MDCTVDGIVANLSGTVSFGGFLGSDTYNHWRNYAKNCTVTGMDVTCAEGDGIYTVGGFMSGQYGGCDPAALYRNSVTGTITSQGTNTESTFGGFIGYVGGRPGGVTECTSNVTITVSGGDVGGFVGETQQYFAHKYDFNSCEANGDVSTESGSAGGFIASVQHGGDGSSLMVSFSDSHATGDVQGSTAGSFIAVVTDEKKGSLTGGAAIVKDDCTASGTPNGENVIEGLIPQIERGDDDPALITSGYFVIYNSNGGKGSMPISAFNKDKGEILSMNLFIMDGYKLSHWTTMADGSGDSYENGATVHFDQDITLYAQWIPGTYTISFDINAPQDSTFSGTMDAMNATYDESYTLTSNAFTVDGYNFAGWSTKADGPVDYVDGAKVLNLTLENNIDLFAIWTELLVQPIDVTPQVENIYDGTTHIFEIKGQVGDEIATITYVLDEKAVTDPKDAGSYDVTISIPETTVGTEKYAEFEMTIKGGLVIKKVQLTATYAGETIKANQHPSLTVSVIGFIDGESASLLGYQVPYISLNDIAVGEYNLTPKGGNPTNNYYFEYAGGTLIVDPAPSLILDANSGTGSMTPLTPDSKDVCTIPANGFASPSGFEFKEWNTEIDGSGTPYDEGDTITISVDTTLYAMWTKTSSDGTEDITQSEVDGHTVTTTKDQSGDITSIEIVSDNGAITKVETEGTAYQVTVTVSAGESLIDVSEHLNIVDDNGIDVSDAEITVTTGSITISFGTDVLDDLIQEADGRDISIVDDEPAYPLTAAQQSAVYNVFSFDLSVTVGGSSLESFEFDYPVTVSIRYNDAAMGSDPGSLGVWHVAADGEKTFMDSNYNTESECYEFDTEHFSLFAVMALPEDGPMFPPFFPFPDDDEFIPPVQVVQPEDDDDSDTAAVCVVAGVVAAVLAVIILADSRRH